MKKFYKPLLILSLFAVLAIASTTAYFTSLAQSSDNVYTSGNLEISVSQDNILSVQNWFPTEEHSMEFTMSNTGSMPEYVKGYLGGDWSTTELDLSVFEVTALERKVNGVWVVLNTSNMTIGEEFYLSADGTENVLLELAPGLSEEFRLTTRLSETTGDEYQNEVFTASLHLAAKQIVPGSEWPAIY